jgi:nucleotide-binding universal stress UspA family protein
VSDRTPKVLVVGAGGREHAIIRALARSSRAPELLATPGNAGIAGDARLIGGDGSVGAVVEAANAEGVDLVVVGPEAPLVDGLVDALVYLSLQELATRISHRNTGKLIGDPMGYEVMARVAADENLHYLFYRDLVSEALTIDPSSVVLAIDRQVREFEMPGTGIHNFTARARSIARAGIYDPVLHYDQVLVPVVLRHWKLEEIEDISPEAEEARTRVLAYMSRLEAIARRLAERRQGQESELIDA